LVFGLWKKVETVKENSEDQKPKAKDRNKKESDTDSFLLL
jgi:hypothetical protein